MPCVITLADLGPSFADVDPVEFDRILLRATAKVLGVAQCQTANEAKWIACCLDPCEAITSLTQHMISMDPEVDGGETTSVSEKVGDVAVTNANVTSSAGIYGGSPYGVGFAGMLGQFKLCQSKRTTTPFAVGGSLWCRC